MLEIITPPIESVEARFGPFGGRYVPETLIPALDELEAAYLACRNDPVFMDEFRTLLHDYVGRPTPITYGETAQFAIGRCANLSQTRRSGPHRRA